MHSQRGHGTMIHRDRASLSPSDVCQSSPITLAYTLGLKRWVVDITTFVVLT